MTEAAHDGRRREVDGIEVDFPGVRVPVVAGAPPGAIVALDARRELSRGSGGCRGRRSWATVYSLRAEREAHAGAPARDERERRLPRCSGGLRWSPATSWTTRRGTGMGDAGAWNPNGNTRNVISRLAMLIKTHKCDVCGEEIGRENGIVGQRELTVEAEGSKVSLMVQVSTLVLGKHCREVEGAAICVDCLMSRLRAWQAGADVPAAESQG